MGRTCLPATSATSVTEFSNGRLDPASVGEHVVEVASSDRRSRRSRCGIAPDLRRTRSRRARLSSQALNAVSSVSAARSSARAAAAGVRRRQAAPQRRQHTHHSNAENLHGRVIVPRSRSPHLGDRVEVGEPLKRLAHTEVEDSAVLAPGVVRAHVHGVFARELIAQARASGGQNLRAPQIPTLPATCASPRTRSAPRRPLGERAAPPARWSPRCRGSGPACSHARP